MARVALGQSTLAVVIGAVLCLIAEFAIAFIVDIYDRLRYELRPWPG